MQLRISDGEPASPDLTRAISDITDFAMVGAQDLGGVVRHAVQVVSTTLAVSHVGVLEYDASSRTFIPHAATGWEARDWSRFAQRMAREPRFRAWAQERGGRGSETGPQGLTLPARILHGFGLNSGVAQVIQGRQSRYGLLALSTVGLRDLERDTGFAHIVANILSLCVARSRTDELTRLCRENAVQAKLDWESTVDALAQIVCLVDGKGRIIRTNRAVEAWRLGEVEMVRGLAMHDLLHPVCTEWHCKLKDGLAQIWSLVAAEGVTEWEQYDQQLGGFIRLSLHRTSGEHDSASYAVLVVEDITEQKRAETALKRYNDELQSKVQERTHELTEANAMLRRQIAEHLQDKEALAESEKKYTCLVENTLTGIYIAYDNKIVFCNKRFQDMFGYSQQELEGMEVDRLFDPAQYRELRERMKSYTTMPYASVILGIRKDGRSIWVKKSFATMSCQGKTSLVGNAIDISRQKRIERQLRRSENELRLLSDQLMSAQESERKRIASELHDGIGQSLGAIKFRVESVMRGLGQGQTGDGGRAQLQEVIRKIQGSIEEVRRISMDLRPSMLDDLGIVATLEWFCREYQETWPGIELRKAVTVSEADLDDSLKVVIFRILQEALNNISKHARATRVKIALKAHQDGLRLRIRDNGRGFDTDKAHRLNAGLGLMSMRERAEVSGGVFDVRSTPGKGTLIEVLWAPSAEAAE